MEPDRKSPFAETKTLLFGAQEYKIVLPAPLVALLPTMKRQAATTLKQPAYQMRRDETLSAAQLQSLDRVVGTLALGGIAPPGEPASDAKEPSFESLYDDLRWYDWFGFDCGFAPVDSLLNDLHCRGRALDAWPSDVLTRCLLAKDVYWRRVFTQPPGA